MKAKVFFNANGRRIAALGLPILYGRQQRQRLPKWAQRAWAAGWIQQGGHGYG
jgi:hypothetical protein